MNNRTVLLFTFISLSCCLSASIAQKKDVLLFKRLNTHPDIFLKDLESEHVFVCNMADEMINTLPTPVLDPKQAYPSGTWVPCTIVTVAELGFPDGASLDAVYREAKRRGLKFCAPELAPSILTLSNNLKEISDFYDIYVAMNPIRCSDGSLRIFEIATDELVCLEGFCGHTCPHGEESEFFKPSIAFLFTK